MCRDKASTTVDVDCDLIYDRDLTRPAVLKAPGLIIEPIKYSRPLEEAAKAGNSGRHTRAINVVAGGRNRHGKH
jgi:hypothetical protein